MGRLRLLALVVLLLVPRPGSAQTPRVSLTVRLDADPQPSGARRPLVQVRGLITDPRWAQALDASLPVILSYKLEIWRSRDGWIDELMRTAEWQTIITKEPLQDEYTVTRVLAKPIVIRFASRDSVAHYMDLPNRIDVAPERSSNFYYTVTLRITALSDADLDEVDRFLEGNPARGENPGTTMLGRGVRRLLLKLAGLPSQELEAKSERFEVRKE